VPQARRRQEIRRFKDDPSCRLFLSTDCGGLGLNLQVAQVVINLDLPWNPAKLEQRIARAWRKHQTRPVSVINLIAEDSIEHRMLPLLALKQALADGVLDGRGDLDSIVLPSGQAAFMERVASIMGGVRPPGAAGAATLSAQEPPPAATAPAEAAEANAPAEPAEPAERLRDDLAAAYSDRLLLLELWAEPARAGGTVVAVLDQAGAVERGAIAAALRRHFGETAPQPEVMVLDRASFEAVERMIEAGLLERTAAGRRLLHRSRSLQGPATDERRRRLEQARELLEQARRKVHMAAVLAGGGFPVEALAPLREGIETGLRSMMLGAEAGETAAASREVPMSWIEAHRERLDGAGLEASSVELVARLRGGPETLLGVGEDEARSWVEGGQRLAARIGESLDQAISRPG
jgi:Helicase conserved C-terminal domain